MCIGDRLSESCQLIISSAAKKKQTKEKKLLRTINARKLKLYMRMLYA